jgi:hypothetical protein
VPTPPVSPEENGRRHTCYIQAGGNVSKAADLAGIKRATYSSWAASQGLRGTGSIAPGSIDLEERIPEGQRLKGVSTLYDAGGEVRAQWVKTDIDREKVLEALRDAIDGLKDEIEQASPVGAPAAFHGDLCNLFTFTDYHLGCLAWHQEGGEDWDVAIAERTLLSAMKAMVAQSPSAHTAIINIQGDFLHTDGKLPVTPAHGHVLDADSRFPKIRRAAIRLIRSLVAQALETHNDVRLIVAEGNHDEESAGWLADCFAVHYELEPRVTVDEGVLPFYCFEWGETMLGVHHGHKVKNEQLPLLFAAQFPGAWGRTRRREIHCGHRHHRDEKEYNGVTVIQHPTLAARDAYAARGGWIADRAAQAITYHRKWGQVGRVMICPEMLQEAA